MYSSSDYWNKFILLYCDFPITIILYTRIARKNYLYSNKYEMWVGIVIAIIALILVIMQGFHLIGRLYQSIFMDINLYSLLESFWSNWYIL